MTEPATTTASAAAVAACSEHPDTRTAAMEVAELLKSSSLSSTDLLVAFASFHHNSALASASELLRRTLSPQVFIAASAESVISSDREIEGTAGFSVIAMQLPGVQLHPWLVTSDVPLKMDDSDAVRERTQPQRDSRGMLVLSDPFSTPIEQFLDVLSTPVNGSAVPIFGGMASGASRPGVNTLVLNERAIHVGSIGVTFSGRLEVDTLVSQGCKPVGQHFVITKCKDNVILELGGRKALEVVREVAEQLAEEDRHMLSRGLMVGRVVNEYRDRFGRGDFLIRNILGIVQDVGGVAIADRPRVGQTVQLHIRDARTADEDLQLLLETQTLQSPPDAALLFTCNGRGSRLFEQRNHDVSALRSRLGEIPLAGFFAAGEFGPVGNHSYLHGHTASVALFRTMR